MMRQWCLSSIEFVEKLSMVIRQAVSDAEWQKDEDGQLVKAATVAEQISWYPYCNTPCVQASVSACMGMAACRFQELAGRCIEIKAYEEALHLLQISQALVKVAKTQDPELVGATWVESVLENFECQHIEFLGELAALWMLSSSDPLNTCLDVIKDIQVPLRHRHIAQGHGTRMHSCLHMYTHACTQPLHAKHLTDAVRRGRRRRGDGRTQACQKVPNDRARNLARVLQHACLLDGFGARHRPTWLSSTPSYLAWLDTRPTWLSGRLLA